MLNKVATRLLSPLAIGIKYAGTRATSTRLYGTYNWGAGDDAFQTVSTVTNSDPADFARHYTENLLLARYDWHALQSQPREVHEYTLAEALLPWRIRAYYRFRTGEYTHLPYEKLELRFHASLFLEHCVHVHPEDKTKIRYYKTREHATQDRHTITTLGRYLTEYYLDSLTSDEIRDISTHFIAGTKRVSVTITADNDEIEAAYRTGPHSCMAYAADHFGLGIHPTRVYGTGSDIHLAILKNKNRQITARVLVWPERKVFGRIYGDHTAMQAQLEALGYEHGSFDGARIKLIRPRADRQHVVMPYIDAYNPNSVYQRNGASYVVDNDTFLTISDLRVANSFTTDSTGGSLSLPRRVPCDCCAVPNYETNLVRIFRDTDDDESDLVCATCLRSDYRYGYRQIYDARRLATVHMRATAPVDYDVDGGRLVRNTSHLRVLTNPAYRNLFPNIVARTFVTANSTSTRPGGTVRSTDLVMLNERVAFNGLKFHGNIAIFRPDRTQHTLHVLDPNDNSIRTTLILAAEEVQQALNAGAAAVADQYNTLTIIDPTVERTEPNFIVSGEAA